MNRKIVWVILFTLAFSLPIVPSIPLVKADSNAIHFSSGVTVLCPVNITYSSNILNLDYTFDSANAGNMLCTLNYSIDGKYGGPMPYAIINPRELHVVYGGKGVVNLPKLSDGSHRLTINVGCVLTGWGLGGNPPGQPFKSTGNQGEYIASWTHTIYFFVDSQSPNIMVTSPQNTTYPTSDIPLNFTLNEQANITYRLDANNATALTQNCTLTGLSIGEHNITINAQDTAGNIATQTANFTITNPTPSPPPPAAEPSAPEPITIAAIILAAGLTIETIVFIIMKRRKT